MLMSLMLLIVAQDSAFDEIDKRDYNENRADFIDTRDFQIY